MPRSFRLTRAAVSVAMLALALGPAACGDGEESSPEQENSSADLGAIKAYLLQHTTRLKADAADIREGAESYYRLAKSAGFDYERLRREDRAQVRAFVKDAQAAFRRANPSYEEMEGVVAGLPELAVYDVIIHAGGDTSDPENAVPFDIETPDGLIFKQTRNSTKSTLIPYTTPIPRPPPKN